jgi:hypothetical protein
MSKKENAWRHRIVTAPQLTDFQRFVDLSALSAGVNAFQLTDLGSMKTSPITYTCQSLYAYVASRNHRALSLRSSPIKDVLQDLGDAVLCCVAHKLFPQKIISQDHDCGATAVALNF